MSIDRFGFLTRTHIQRLHTLGGDRNAQKVLKGMEEYLHSFRNGYDTVYYLNRLGRDMIGSSKQVKQSMQTKHYLMRNDFYFHIGCPSQWNNEKKVTDEKVTIVTDAIFVKDSKYHFVEIDNTQTMSQNKLKIERYKQLFNNGIFTKQFGYFPLLHIVTTNKSRVRRFKEMCDSLPVMVYLIDDIK